MAKAQRLTAAQLRKDMGVVDPDATPAPVVKAEPEPVKGAQTGTSGIAKSVVWAHLRERIKAHRAK